MRLFTGVLAATTIFAAIAFQPISDHSRCKSTSPAATTATQLNALSSRREWLVAGAMTTGVLTTGLPVEPAHAVGPVKINLLNPKYRARPCPRDKPIPGEKAMKGMKVRRKDVHMTEFLDDSE